MSVGFFLIPITTIKMFEKALFNIIKQDKDKYKNWKGRNCKYHYLQIDQMPSLEKFIGSTEKQLQTIKIR